MQLWDNGTWRPLSDHPQEDLEKGHIKFEMRGKRMKGRWVLVRMKDRPEDRGRHNWLLIKEIDDEAKRGAAGDALAKEVTSVKSGRTMDEIAQSTRKVWNSNQSVADNVKALKSKKAASAVKKKVLKKKKAAVSRAKSRK